ncbi:MFS transporter [Microbacterium sp. KUDC0406]|uniref:MFS transporter n=1 Tax=Microbacterium sp. KUDC0406 TaxID=2909588 RepID=UPI001F256144|nr:MFS transporter [Microbacterium sp. KUDC0406]UJP10339.1 MFS transporter [Microbacterium sp. KUDC0406]
MTESSTISTRHASLRIARRLAPSQALAVFGSSIDLTLTGIVGHHLAPTDALATLPFSLIAVGALSSTFVVSRTIGRFGYRKTFVLFSGAAIASGLISALAVQWGSFWLLCAGTFLIGLYGAATGYYRYAAADTAQGARAAAVTTVLAGGLVAALIGPFLATWTADLLPVTYVASYVLVAVFGVIAALWNAMLPAELGRMTTGPAVGSGGRSRRVLWRQPILLAGVLTTAFAAVAMNAMMTAGPIAGMAMGHSEAAAAFAVQLHMVGMFAPGFFVARIIDRIGERAITSIGIVLILVSGAVAAFSTAEWAFFTAMLTIGVGWNLTFSGGSALITSTYRAEERGRVQPIAETITGSFQVIGSLGAGAMASVAGWQLLGLGVVAACFLVALATAKLRRRADPSPARAGTSDVTP